MSESTGRTPTIAEKITVSLTAKGKDALFRLQSTEDLNKADAVNRALQIYAMIAEREARGDTLCFRAPNGDVTEMFLL